MSFEMLIENMDDGVCAMMLESAIEDACLHGGEKVINIFETFCDIEEAGKVNQKLEETVSNFILPMFESNLPLFEVVFSAKDNISGMSNAADSAGYMTGKNKKNKGTAAGTPDNEGNRASGAVSSKTNQPGKMSAAWQAIKAKYHNKGGITGMMRKAVGKAKINMANTYNKSKALLGAGAKNVASTVKNMAAGVKAGAKAYQAQKMATA